MRFCPPTYIGRYALYLYMYFVNPEFDRPAVNDVKVTSCSVDFDKN